MKRRNWTHLILALSLLVASVACHKAPTVNVAAEQQTLMAMETAWSQAASQKDLNTTMSYYAADGVLYPSNMPVATGTEAMQKVWSQFMADPNFSLSWKPVSATVAQSGDIAFTTGTYQGTFTMPDGKPKSVVGKYMCTWKKDVSGKWVATHDIWNEDSL